MDFSMTLRQPAGYNGLASAGRLQIIDFVGEAL
jgi:hypothetical protein